MVLGLKQLDKKLKHMFDEEFKKSIVDFYTPEELIELLSPFSDEEFLELVEQLEEKILYNIDELKEQMNHD